MPEDRRRGHGARGRAVPRRLAAVGHLTKRRRLGPLAGAPPEAGPQAQVAPAQLNIKQYALSRTATALATHGTSPQQALHPQTPASRAHLPLHPQPIASVATRAIPTGRASGCILLQTRPQPGRRQPINTRAPALGPAHPPAPDRGLRAVPRTYSPADLSRP